MDVVQVANETVDPRIKLEKPGVLCKLDIEKAYDHESNFLVNMMERMGFGLKGIKWVK